MKLCKKEQAIQRNNGDCCIVTECPIEDASLNMAITKISGRYPDRGYAINHQVNEMVYIQEGHGNVTINDNTIPIEKGDVVLIEPGEQFFWSGDFTAVIACNPAFTAEQHEVLEKQVCKQ